MFRSTGNSEMNVKHFGVGSTIEGRYLLVKTGLDCTGSHVSVLNLSTFIVSEKSVCVEDMHYLSKDEFVRVLGLIKEKPFTNWAVSDFSVDAKGMKCTQ